MTDSISKSNTDFSSSGTDSWSGNTKVKQILINHVSGLSETVME